MLITRVLSTYYQHWHFLPLFKLVAFPLQNKLPPPFFFEDNPFWSQGQVALPSQVSPVLLNLRGLIWEK
jgi:hypothetical protein